MNYPRLTVLGLLLAVGMADPDRAQAQIGFAQNQADRIRLWNADYFELAFRKADGRLLYIVDKTTGQQVSPGNVHGPWVLRFSNNTWLDGENFSTTNPSRLFSYTWNATDSILTLNYVATGSQTCNVSVVITPTLGPEVNSVLSITNQSGMKVELLAYPVQLSFLRNQIAGVYVPYMEGMRLSSSFFPAYDFTSGYPGQMFADFAYTELTSGAFAVYTVQDPKEPIISSAWAILQDSYAGGVSKYHHDYTLDLANGQSWTSPVTVFNVGSSVADSMATYWTRNGLDTIPSLEQKLGTSLFKKLANAVLLKRDFLQGSWTFLTFQSALASIPAGNLLHFVAFWPNGFDENYPDYLPPNPSLGTLAQLQTLVATARSSGHLVMPYTNPTWWDDQSPTLNSLGTGIVTRNRQGNLISETYGSHGGYVVSPYAADVIERQDQTRDEFTQTVPCDLMFEDQVGARSNPAFANHPECPSPVEYIQGLMNVAERSSTWLPIMSEGGYDRLSRFESGYCLSHTIGWHWWPSNTYRPYPMAPLWAHDKLYFSAHNLAGSSMVTDLPKLSYYISVGYSLSYDLSMLNQSWLKLLDCFQKNLVSKLIGVGMSSYELLPTNGQSRTTFANGVVVTANLTGGSMAVDNHVVSPNGFIAVQDGNVLGGALSTLHGNALAGSAPHYLAIDHAPYRIRICQPLGDNGNLIFPRPATWAEDSRIRAVAVTESGAEFSRTVTIAPTTVGINYVSQISGQDVRYFLIVYCRAPDSDCDGFVDADDFVSFEDCMFGPETTVSPTPPQTEPQCLDAFDDNSDSDVDLHDLMLFQLSFDALP
ncbi:hypothetical protein B7486_13665 [cyanobacterium TDX16]|nr:hypothetical protein B7486_13665 [cyanobacterium TDX16]